MVTGGHLMATIYPLNPDFKNIAEKEVYYFFKKNLSNIYVVYYNYHIYNREFDFVILVPNKGICVIEVKGWKASEIDHVEDNDTIYQKQKIGLPIPWSSPFKQANDYRYMFINKIKDEIKKDLLVIPLVCYPYIKKDEFYEKRLDIVSNEKLTILVEDLVNQESIENKLDEAFAFFNNIGHDPFTLDYMNKIRRWYENEEQIENTLKQLIPNGKTKIILKKPREYYSLLTYLPRDVSFTQAESLIDEQIEHWNRGTKIYFFTNYEDYKALFDKKLRRRVEELNLNDFFTDEDGKLNIFNVFAYKVDYDEQNVVSITDGKNYVQFKAMLQTFHEQTYFNFDQYAVEHAPIEENIIIKAGAGSGKTFSMISRINYLLYVHKLNEKTLKESIYMITFTNEAARNMKERLQQNFYNYYLITRNYEFFKLIETIDNMKISTIHSLAKRVLKRYAVKLGLGKDIQIVSGKYERDQILTNVLNGYIIQKQKTDQEFVERLGISMYNLQERLKAFMEKIENKNLDILNDPLDFGRSQYPELDQLIETVLKRTEEKLRSNLDARNNIRLSDLMIRLKTLVKNEPLTFDGIPVKYVFIDEFQDTDDVQIELIKQFQQAIGFHLFVVGDVKQCIYRFRGAEDKAFDKLSSDNHLTFLPDYSLTKNYRTDRLLLNEFEKRFEAWGQSSERLLDYNPAYDRLKSHEVLNRETDQFFRSIQVSDKSKNEEFEQKFIETIKEEYNRLSKNGTLAILVRENWEVDYIRKLGQKEGIYIETDHGGDLFQLESTIDFYKLIIALQNPKNPKHLINLFNSNYVTKTIDKKQVYLRRNNDKELLDYFKRIDPIPNWEKHLSDLKKEPVLYVLRNIVLQTQPWEVFAKRNYASEENQEKAKSFYKRNLDQLFEHIITIGHQDYLTINKIERFLYIMIMTDQKQQSRESFNVELEHDAKNIVCMTVHKSKGLEFETVILPFTDKTLVSDRRIGMLDLIISPNFKVGYKMRLDEDNQYVVNNYYNDEIDVEKKHKLKEETRILYVAMTRAIKTFVYFEYENIQKEKTWQHLLTEGSS